MDEVLEVLEKAEVPVMSGPVLRTDGRGVGSAPSRSVYIRDPDENLLEFMVYDS